MLSGYYSIIFKINQVTTVFDFFRKGVKKEG